MSQISGSKDVYRQLVEESEEDWLYGLVAFAIHEEQRIEWMTHFEERNGHGPSVDEIQHWYEQQPVGALLRVKGEAEHALKLYADDVLQEILEIERREVADGVIISEIRLTQKFLPQFGRNVLAGFASAFLFAAVLVVLAFVILADTSPVNLMKGIGNHQTQEKVNGETDGKSGSDQ